MHHLLEIFFYLSEHSQAYSFKLSYSGCIAHGGIKYLSGYKGIIIVRILSSVKHEDFLPMKPHFILSVFESRNLQNRQRHCWFVDSIIRLPSTARIGPNPTATLYKAMKRVVIFSDNLTAYGFLRRLELDRRWKEIFQSLMCILNEYKISYTELRCVVLSFFQPLLRLRGESNLHVSIAKQVYKWVDQYKLAGSGVFSSLNTGTALTI